MAKYDRQAALERVAFAVAAAFQRLDDPGVSDLEDEQPMSVHLTLGVLRAAYFASQAKVVAKVEGQK